VSVPLGSGSAAVEAFRTRTPRFVGDGDRRPSAGEHLSAETGSRALYALPVMRGEAVVGVLVLGYRRALRRFPSRVAECVEVLAAEASLAFERADLLARLAAAAHTDGLTGAANRRGWDIAVASDLLPATGTPRVVALLDLDHFKKYNDTFGHQAGDELLTECAARWRDVLRAGDTLARWGGEEFAVLLPACDPEQAAPILDRLRACVPFGCTVSAGVTLTYGGESPGAVLARADAALYRAKDGGRDRAVWQTTTVVDLLDAQLAERT
jgi:diguanylate cyclase (GGDEF)-like protein